MVVKRENRKAVRGGRKINFGTAEQVSDAVHGLLHAIDDQNHRWTSLESGKRSIDALEVFADLPIKRRTAEGECQFLSPVVGFDRTFCEITFIATNSADHSHWLDEPIGRFEYSDEDLLVQVFRCLKKHGLKVPAKVLLLARRRWQEIMDQSESRGSHGR